MKFLILDAGPIISLTMNGLLPVLEKLKKEFNGKFIITPHVRKEVIDKPMKIGKYKFEAVLVKDLLDRKVLSLSSEIIGNNQLDSETKKIMDNVNSIFKSVEGKINLIQEGEASCLAFSNLCNCDNVIAVDERSVRILVEAPENLKGLLEKKLHTSVIVNHSNLKKLKNFKFIRSAELMYVAYKKDLFGIKKTKELLDAVLYAVKFKGAAISSKEIEEMKRLV